MHGFRIFVTESLSAIHGAHIERVQIGSEVVLIGTLPHRYKMRMLKNNVFILVCAADKFSEFT